MHRKTIFIVLFSVIAINSYAQKYITREGYIKFFGSTPLENIEAVTNQASSVIDAANDAIVFQVLLNSFSFEKALMQEHFNENYVESEKFPKAVFKGKIEGDVDYSQPGKYEVKIAGNMNLHGVDRAITEPATIIVEKGAIKISSEFKMVPEEYDIEIPSAVRDKIAKEIDVTVKCMYKPVK